MQRHGRDLEPLDPQPPQRRGDRGQQPALRLRVLPPRVAPRGAAPQRQGAAPAEPGEVGRGEVAGEGEVEGRRRRRGALFLSVAVAVAVAVALSFAAVFVFLLLLLLLPDDARDRSQRPRVQLHHPALQDPLGPRVRHARAEEPVRDPRRGAPDLLGHFRRVGAELSRGDALARRRQPRAQQPLGDVGGPRGVVLGPEHVPLQGRGLDRGGGGAGAGLAAPPALGGALGPASGTLALEVLPVVGKLPLVAAKVAERQLVLVVVGGEGAIVVLVVVFDVQVEDVCGPARGVQVLLAARGLLAELGHELLDVVAAKDVVELVGDGVRQVPRRRASRASPRRAAGAPDGLLVGAVLDEAGHLVVDVVLEHVRGGAAAVVSSVSVAVAAAARRRRRAVSPGDSGSGSSFASAALGRTSTIIVVA